MMTIEKMLFYFGSTKSSCHPRIARTLSPRTPGILTVLQPTQDGAMLISRLRCVVLPSHLHCGVFALCVHANARPSAFRRGLVSRGSGALEQKASPRCNAS